MYVNRFTDVFDKFLNFPFFLFLGVYLHDPRCICREAKTKTRRKNKDDVVLDSMFWPIMSYNSVAVKLDNNRQPHVIQPYNVPPAQNDQFRLHDEAVYSLWMHFVDFCLATSDSAHLGYSDDAPCYAAPDLPVNSYTKLPRLPVFRVLSGANNHEIRREEIVAAEFAGNFVEHTGPADFAAKACLRRITALSNHQQEFVKPQIMSRISTESDAATSISTDSRRSSLNDFGINNQLNEKDFAMHGDLGRPETNESISYRFSPDAISQLWKQRNTNVIRDNSGAANNHFMSLASYSREFLA
jgi:hypothetical protein